MNRNLSASAKAKSVAILALTGQNERVKKNLFPPGKKFGYLDACYKAQVSNETIR